MDYIYGAVALRERLLDIAGSARVLFVTWAEVDQSYIFRETLAAGEGKTLPRLDGFDRISPFLEDDKSPFFALLHGEAWELHCALELYTTRNTCRVSQNPFAVRRTRSASDFSTCFKAMNRFSGKWQRTWGSAPISARTAACTSAIV
jgi:hypothetical protein